MIYFKKALQLLEEKQKRIQARKNFLSFVQYTKSDYITNWHHKVMADVIQQWIYDPNFNNLIISAPPRHGKSELISRRLPAYLFGINPDNQIISTNYNNELAQIMSRDVQRIIESDKYHRLFPDTTIIGEKTKLKKYERYIKTLNHFQIVRKKGNYYASGLRTGITGKGAYYFLIDDYIKNYKESTSKVIKNDVWNEYLYTLKTRLEGPKKQLITATRWANDDLIGRLLKISKEKWVIINLEAIRTNKPYPYDPRKEGEALWPWKMSLNELKAAMEINPLGFITMYQGYPPTEIGSIFKSSWWAYYDEFPRGPYQIYQSWDTAFKTGQENDYNVCTTWRVYTDGYYLVDVYRARLAYPDLKQKAIELYHKYNPNLILIEDKASGQSLIQDLSRGIMPIMAISVDSDKITRANAVSGLYQSGKVKLCKKAPWLFDYTEELEHFGHGCEFDDQVDSSTQFLNYIKPADIINDIVVGESECSEEF